MPRFSYKAATTGGDVIEGVIEAANRQAVIDRLRGQGHVPIRADEVTGDTRRGLGAGWLLLRRRVGPKDVVIKTRELATLLHAGLPLDRCLAIICDLSRPGPVQTLMERIREEVRGGISLADALDAHPDVFPGFYVGMVRAGEASGNLDDVLVALADSLERAQKLRESVQSALQYPVLVVIMAVLTLVILMTAVVPEFEPLFENAGTEMPLLTQGVIAVSDFLGLYWWAMLVLIFALILVVRRHNRDPKGRLRWDRWVLGLPVLGTLVRKIETARFSRALGTLSRSGVNLLNAMSMTIATVENRVIAEALGDVRARLAKGEGLSRPLFETRVIPTMAVQLIQVGEESGALEDMLLRVADIYDDEVQRSLQSMLGMLTPAIIIVLGIVIAIIIGSIVSAILSAYDLPI